MSEVQVRAQVSASSYRSPIEPALSLKTALGTYDRDKDRRSLLCALKEQFLLNRLVAASQAENTRYLALQILFNRIEHMSDKMLLKTVRVLSEIGALDLAAVTGTSVPVSETPMVSIQQAFGLPGGGSQPSLGDGSASNLVKDLFAAHEHIITHLRDKAAHQIEPDLDSIGKTHPLSLSVYINRKKVIADDQSPGTGPAGPKAAVL